MSLKIIDSERIIVKGVTYRFKDDPLGNCRCCDLHTVGTSGEFCAQTSAPCTSTLREDGREGHYRREQV